MALNWKFWPVLGGLSVVAVVVFTVPTSPAYYDTDRPMIGQYVTIVHSENGVCLTEHASDGLTKKIMDCFAEVGAVVLIQYERGQSSAVPIGDIATFATGGGTAVESGNTPIHLVVTTHYPACTAIFMHGRDGVTLQTELPPDFLPETSYTDEEIRAGINLTYTTTANLADELIPDLVERPAVSAVASYSASYPPELLANATSPDPWSFVCAPISFGLFGIVYDDVWSWSRASGDSIDSDASTSSGSSEDSGTAASERLENVFIATSNNNMEVLVFLEEHGITQFRASEPTPGTPQSGFICAIVPVPLLPEIARMDNVMKVTFNTPSFKHCRDLEHTGAASGIPSEIAAANNRFALDFYRQVSSQDGNVFFSPLSVYTAFSMLYEGAAGETAVQMQDVFGFEPDEHLRHNATAALMSSLNQYDQHTTLTLANSLWLAGGFEPYTSYVDVLNGAYMTDIDSVDFSEEGMEETIDLINGWAAGKTRGKIPSVLGPQDVHNGTSLVLVNAIYFKGSWETQFNPGHTAKDNFWTGTQNVTADFMWMTDRFVYAEYDGAQVLRMPYDGDRLSMAVILPREMDGLDQLTDSLTAEQLDVWLDVDWTRKVVVEIPKFEVRTGYDLVRPLTSMGVNDVFDNKTS